MEATQAAPVAGQVNQEDTKDGDGIGWAVKQMWDGKKVCRSGWNGNNMWIALQRPYEKSKGMTLPYIYMYTSTCDLIPWLASQTDLLAVDWEIVE